MNSTVDKVFTALFEISILSEIGIPFLDTINILSKSYTSQHKIDAILLELKESFIKKIPPKINEFDSFENLVINDFFWIGLSSGSIENSLKAACYLFLLSKHLKKNDCRAIDLKFSKSILETFQNDHPVLSKLESLSKEKLWTYEKMMAVPNPVDFETWVAQFEAISENPAEKPIEIPFQFIEQLKKQLVIIEDTNREEPLLSSWRNYILANSLA